MEEALGVTLGVTHHITWHETKKKWTIGDGLLFESENDLGETVEWLKLSATAYGLCNLLTSEKLKDTKPSLRESEGYKSLLAKRTEALNTVLKGDLTLWGEVEHEHESMAKKKRKLEKLSTKPKSLELDLGDHGKLRCLTPSRNTEDLTILFNAEAIMTFLTYMTATGCDALLSGNKRSYIQSGKFKQKPAEDAAEEAK